MFILCQYVHRLELRMFFPNFVLRVYQLNAFPPQCPPLTTSTAGVAGLVKREIRTTFFSKKQFNFLLRSLEKIQYKKYPSIIVLMDAAQKQYILYFVT